MLPDWTDSRFASDEFGRVQADLDWWNEEVASWLHSVLWVPHHVVALIACLTGFLLLWRVEGDRVASSILIACLAFTSAVGCSVYVTLVFAVFLALWTGVAFLARRSQEGLAFVCTGIIAVVLSLPHLRTLVPEKVIPVAATAEAGKSLFTLSVRSFMPAEILVRSSYPDRGWLVSSSIRCSSR